MGVNRDHFVCFAIYLYPQGLNKLVKWYALLVHLYATAELKIRIWIDSYFAF